MITPGSSSDDGFVLSENPVVPRIDRATGETDYLDYENLGELPRSYGAPHLFLIARDPRTLFAYWDIDWSAAFGQSVPAERKVYLRLFTPQNVEEVSVTVEPMAGNSYVTVSQPAGSYRAEIGYYEPAEVWNSLAASAPVTTPAEGFAELTPVDVATVPFHLSFQKMIDLFRESKQAGESLTDMLGRLRKRAGEKGRKKLTAGEKEMMRAFEQTAADVGARQAEPAELDARLQRKLEKILGFGSSSPTNGFGGSSWSGSSRH